MSHVASLVWSVCLYVHHTIYCAKTAELIEMLFGGLTYVRSKEPCIRYEIKTGWIHSQPWKV